MSLPEGWRETTLGEVLVKIIDYRGKTPKKLGSDWTINGKYRALSAKSVKTGGLVNLEQINRVDEELYKKWMKEEILFNDILMTSEAPMGEVIIWKSNEKIVLSQRLFALRAKENISPSYLYYQFISRNFQFELQARASGTTVFGIKQTELVKTKLNLPPLQEQKAIASILSSFDEKIELLKAQNETLEQMAQGVFREWFVDGVDESEYSSIEDTDYDILDGDRGKNYPKNDELFADEYCLFLNAKNITKKGFSFNEKSFITKEKDALLGKGKLKRYDIVLTTRGTVGNIAYYSSNIEYHNMRINSGMVIIRSNTVEESLYLYILMKNTFFKHSMEQVISGSAQPQLPIRDLKQILIIYPSKDKIKDFINIVAPFYLKLENNTEQIQTLQKTRDTLLPKLMSGELRVKGVADA